MEELNRAVIASLAFEAGFGRHQVMPEITKYERLARLIQKQLEENDYATEGNTESD